MLRGKVINWSTWLITIGTFSVSFDLADSYTKELMNLNSSTQSCLNNEISTCPVWASCNELDNVCRCLPNNKYIFLCDPEGMKNYVLSCYCVTYNIKLGIVEVGPCLYNCDSVKKNKVSIKTYYLLPSNASSNASDWNEAMCGVYNRTGTLCGQCVNNTYLPAYSYDMTCRTCGSRLTSLIKYITVAYGLLTLFCVIVVATRLNVASYPLQGYVFFCQILSCPIFARNILFYLGDGPEATYYKIVPQLLGTLYGIWNLDFLRWFNLDICFEVHSITVFSLDFFVALYPLLLMILIYWVITLYDSNNRVIRVIFSPIEVIFTHYKWNWNAKSSIIHAFATFLILSNVKFLNVCYDLLVPVTICDPSINGTCRHALFNDAIVPYFRSHHIPYAVSALFVLAGFVALPILILALYPFKLCQNLLGTIPQRHQIILHVFMDSIQGCYKDGTELDGRDCRWFSAVPFLVRLIIFALFAISKSMYFLANCVMILVLYTILLIIVEPHKPQFKHHSHHSIIFILLLCCCIMCAEGLHSGMSIALFFYAIVCMTGLVQLAYMSAYMCINLKHYIFN